MNEEPLIYTKHGNVPISGLSYSTKATIVNDNVVLREEWRDATGDEVKSNVHVIPLKGMDMSPEQGGIPGA